MSGRSIAIPSVASIPSRPLATGITGKDKFWLAESRGQISRRRKDVEHHDRNVVENELLRRNGCHLDMVLILVDQGKHAYVRVRQASKDELNLHFAQDKNEVQWQDRFF